MAKRFASVQDILQAYPQLGLGFGSAIDSSPALDFAARLLAEGRWADAVACVAYLLPRREAVWWVSCCVRAAPRSFEAPEERLIASAEAWVKDPSEESRRHALTLARDVDSTRAAGWAARAAGWSGGILTESGDSKVMCQAYMTHAAVRGGVLVACGATDDPRSYLKSCVESGMAIVKRADAR